MPSKLEVLFTPAEFVALAARDLSKSACVVFDVLRATSSIVTALAHGARAIIPVEEISDALAVRKQKPGVLLAGERNGLRIRASQTGGTVFDLGNSPREFTAGRVNGKTIVITTTNGSRALRASAKAADVLVGSFLNLSATAQHLREKRAQELLLICSGTHDQAAYEDILGAGALAERLWPMYAKGEIADSANVALQVYQKYSLNLSESIEQSRNARRLMSIPELSADVSYCLRLDVFPIVAQLRDGLITRRDK